MNNNKGFTLVELLATIAILAVILLIAIPIYNTVSNAIRDRQRNNLIELIEVEASRYAFDTGDTYAFVDTLIKKGYLKADNEQGDILDPTNNYKMNCYIVKMTKKGDKFIAKFLDENYPLDDGCDESKLVDNSLNLDINVYANNKLVTNNNEWLKGSVTLEVVSDNILIDCNKSKCTWTSTAGANINGKESILVSGLDKLNTKYTFQLSTLDEFDNTLKKYAKSVAVKIDNEPPVINAEDTTISNKNVVTVSKNVTIAASDGSGSGISSYALVKSDEASASTVCRLNTVEYQSSKRFKVTENGNYVICVKDKVGNIASFAPLVVSNIG